MENQNQTTNVPNPMGANPVAPAGNGAPTAAPVVAPEKPVEEPKVSRVAQADFVKQIIEKLRKSENILVALSNNPNIDEIAAAIAMTIYLDSMQRHVTAIYSGEIPGALNFLRPEATFETNTASLQDFIIALSKDKADHLRYKLEGDYVKVYITPYRTEITADDLTYSKGDYNVDFVLALNVKLASELDGALSDYGRILHDAAVANITCDTPGKFGEIEWCDPTASSVSEMIARLIFEMQGTEKPLDKDVATALLTGIVAATDRFSNGKTNSETLGLASRLMTMGADQQLIAAHVMDNANPAAQAAPVLEDTEPPVDLSIPEVPLSAEEVVVQPMNINLPAEEAAPVDQPAVQGTGAVVTELPPAPTVEPGKDYATMMQEALATAPAPEMPPMPGMGMPQAEAPSVPNVETMSVPTMAPVPGAEQMPPMPMANPAVAGEPVARPETVLPPPPAPVIPEGMGPEANPPSLPPVQM